MLEIRSKWDIYYEIEEGETIEEAKEKSYLLVVEALEKAGLCGQVYEQVEQEV